MALFFIFSGSNINLNRFWSECVRHLHYQVWVSIELVRCYDISQILMFELNIRFFCDVLITLGFVSYLMGFIEKG